MEGNTYMYYKSRLGEQCRDDNVNTKLESWCIIGSIKAVPYISFKVTNL